MPTPPEPHAKRHPPTRAEFEARGREARADIEARAQDARAQFDATQEKIRARTGRNLLAAIGIGVALGAVFLVSLIILKWLFIIFGAALIGFTVFELSSAVPSPVPPSSRSPGTNVKSRDRNSRYSAKE